MIGRPGMLAMLVLASLLSCGTTASAQSRHALVVGIDAYRNVAQLSRAVADARAMNATLQGLGFKTRLVENPDRNAMSVALAGFEESIEKGDTAFVFFAGHGIEIAGQNVLLPADVPDPGRASSGILRDAGLNTATLIERIPRAERVLPSSCSMPAAITLTRRRAIPVRSARLAGLRVPKHRKACSC